MSLDPTTKYTDDVGLSYIASIDAATRVRFEHAQLFFGKQEGEMVTREEYLFILGLEVGRMPRVYAGYRRYAI